MLVIYHKNNAVSMRESCAKLPVIQLFDIALLKDFQKHF